MGQNLRARLQRIRDTAKASRPGAAVRTPPFCGAPPSGAASRSAPGPEWISAGYQTLQRSVLLDFPRPPPFPLPPPLAILIPDLDRYAAGRMPAPEDLVFFDLETTGLSGGAGTVAFLAAFGRFVSGPGGTLKLRTDQYLLLDYPGEGDFLAAVLENMARREDPLLVSYNGKSFDAQILKTRCLMRGVTPPAYRHADLLHPSRRLWKRILPSCSQGEIERAALGLDRTGDTPGALAPDLWFSFLRTGDGPALGGICDHNLRDILGLASIFAALARIALDPLGAGEAYHADREALALRWRAALRGDSSLPGRARRAIPGAAETAERLLDAAEQDHPLVGYIRGLDLIRGGFFDGGRTRLRALLEKTMPPRLRAAILRTLAVDAEWRLRDRPAALAYTLEALDLEGLAKAMKDDLIRRRGRLSAGVIPDPGGEFPGG